MAISCWFAYFTICYCITYFIWFADLTMYLELPEIFTSQNIHRRTLITYVHWPHLYCSIRLGKKKNHFNVIVAWMEAGYVWLNKLRCLEVIESQKIMAITNVHFSGKLLPPVILVFFPSILIWFWILNERLKTKLLPLILLFVWIYWEFAREKGTTSYYRIAWPSGHDFVTIFSCLSNRQPSLSWLSSDRNKYWIPIEYI